MKVIAALVWTVFGTYSSAAQVYYCSRPSEPYIRSGYSADYDQMNRTQDEVHEYLEDMNEYLRCIANEHDDARNELNQLVDEWDTAVRRFNNR